VEILALRHQITVLERQLGGDPVKFALEDRALLAALLAPLPRYLLRRATAVQDLVRDCAMIPSHVAAPGVPGHYQRVRAVAEFVDMVRVEVIRARVSRTVHLN
jgi:hypothetical protein